MPTWGCQAGDQAKVWLRPKPALPPSGCKPSVLASPAAQFVPFASLTCSPLFTMETAPQHLGGPSHPSCHCMRLAGAGSTPRSVGGSGPLIWVGGNLVHSFCFPRMEEDEGPGMAVRPWPPAAGACHQRRAPHSLCPAGQSLSQRETITQDDPGFVSESAILPCGYLP